MSRVVRYLARLSEMKRRKQPWLDHYQRLAEIFLTRKADFTNAQCLGAFLQDNVYTNIPQFAADLHAAVFCSMLWPDAGRSFRLVPKPYLKVLTGVQEYYRAKNEWMHATMDNPEAGYTLALGEHCHEQGVFGTSGLATLEGDDDEAGGPPATYECWEVKTMYIDENRRKYVDTAYIEEVRTVRQIYDEYVGNKRPGDKISAKVMELYQQGKFDDKVIRLIVIEPNPRRKPGKKGVLAMKYSSTHIDTKNRTIMRESGFEEMPVAVVRAAKRAGEKQGRSPGMIALPAAVNLNSIAQDIIVASEQRLWPPLLVLDDGRLGGTVIDASARGTTVVNTAGRPFGEKPIQPLHVVGDEQMAKDHKAELRDEVMQAFHLDRLLDLNNKTMMTAYETSVRNRIRGESTGSMFARQIMEALIPTIRRTYNIGFRKGYFGDFPGVEGPGTVMRQKWLRVGAKDPFQVPEAVLRAVEAGLPTYDIEFISPAARFMQAEKLQGLMTSMDAKLAVASVRPDILDGTDLDEWSREIDRYAGAPSDSQRTKGDLEKYRAEIAKKQQVADTLQAGQAAADIQGKVASARATLGTANK